VALRCYREARSSGRAISALTLEGKVEADGSATLIAKGLSPSSENDVAFPSPQGRISFRVTAKFDETLGTGRVGVRGCKFTFSKH
jgi:hypothetical protein